MEKTLKTEKSGKTGPVTKAEKVDKSEKGEKADKELAKAEAIRQLASQFDFDSTAVEFHILLQHAARKVAEMAEANLAAMGVTLGRFIPLAVLFTAKGRRKKPSELAESCGVTRATMTGLIDALETDELVRRVTQENDRRAVDIELTPKGEKFARKLLPMHFKAVSRMMSGITEAERKALAGAFKKISANIEKPAK